MALKAAMWVHGTATEVEFPQNLHSDGIMREGIGTHFFSGAGTFNWFHIPIPTPVVLDGVRPTLVGVFLFYNKASASSVRRTATSCRKAASC